MNLPNIVSSGDNTNVKKTKTPVKIPWQVGGGGDTDDWMPGRCRPTSFEQAKHKYEGILRGRDESRKVDIAKKMFRDRLRKKPVIKYPSEDDEVTRVESPFAVMESDLLESYHCRPPKVSPSLMELLDKYYDPINREFHPSYLDLPAVQTEPIVQYTGTAQSILKNRREKKERRMLRVKQDEISNLIRTRIKGLKRLRDGYVNTENKYKCHFTERKNAKTKEKKDYINGLAEKYNCSGKLLESRTDSLYEKYIESKKEKLRSERQYVEGTLEWMERLLQEERKKEKLEKPPKPFVYRKRTKPLAVEEFTTLPPPTLIPIPEEEVEDSKEGEDTNAKETEDQNKGSPSKKSRRSSRRQSRKSSRRSSRRTSRKSSRRASRRQSRRASRKGSKKKSDVRSSKRKDTKKYSKKPKPSVLEPYTEPQPVSVLDPELVGMFRQWEEKRLEVERLKIKGAGLPPKDSAYTAKPPLILINNFLPNVVYTKKVKLINRNNQRAYCRPYIIRMEPDDDQGVLKVEPWRVLSSPPGIYPVVNVVFSPVENTGRIEADIIFLSRHPPKSWKSFSFHVTCIPPTPQISIEPVLFSFPPMKIWSQEVLTQHFTVTNKGAVACTLFVRKKDDKYPCSNCDELEMMYEEDYEDSNQIKFDSLFCIYPSVKFMELKDKKKAKPKMRFPKEEPLIDDESELVVSGIVNRLFNKVFETFTFDRKYEIEIPGRSRLRVSLAFKPRFAPNLGTVHEEWCLFFTDFWNFCHTQVINIFAQIESTPLYVKPLVLDMKLCLLENGVQQDSFIVGNKGRRGHQLVVKIPPALSKQAVIHNPGPLVLGGEEVKILVRVDLKYSFCAESTEFYDPATNILDFPVYVSSKDENETGPPLIVRVMAIVSRSMGLQVMPALINYGVVYTYQSAVASFCLANHSLAKHKFAFLNLPKWAMIQPGYGFGEIGAGEKLKFELIYSPTEELVAWPGGSSEHFFILIATTMDRLANHQPVHKLISVDHRHEQQFPEDYDVKDTDYPPTEDVIPEDQADVIKVRKGTSVASKKGFKKSFGGSKIGTKKLKSSKVKVKESSAAGGIVTASGERVNQDPLDFNFVMPDFDELLELYKRKSIFGDELLPYGAEDKSTKRSKSKLSMIVPARDKVNTLNDGSSSPEENKEGTDELQNEVEILPICNTPDPVFTYLAVRAVVIDPHCELSAQRIVLPPTPYYSYTITPFFLRCPNLQTYKICYCGKDINKSHAEPPKVRARYEFFSSLPYLNVEPCSGQIFSGQNVKINIIVRPRLDQREILEQAKILKAIAERERLLRERRKRRDRQTGSRRSSRRSSRRASRRSSRRTSRRGSTKSSGKKKSIGGPPRKSMKRKSVAKRQSSSPGKRKSAVGKRKSAVGKRQSAVGKRQSVAGKKRKNMGGNYRKDGSKKSSGHSEQDEKDIIVNPQQMVVDEGDLFNAKLNLMRYKEPENFATKVVCYIETELENPPYTKRREELELFIYGTLVRPDIVVFTPPNLDQHIKFETTAVGLKRKLFFQVYNTSGGTVLLNQSFFDAPETYYIPLRLPLDQHRPNNYLKTGMWLEPDHHVNFPIIFAPKKEKTISEFIEIRGNKTVVPLKIQGRGVEPKFKITPEFIVGKLRSNQGHPAKILFMIENQCDAELEFSFLKIYTKEGPIYPLDPPKPGKGSSSKGKKPSRGGRKSVSSRKSVTRKSVARKSVARKSVARKSVARKSVSRKSVARKSVAGGKLKSDKKNGEADMVVDKGEIKDEGRKNLAAAGGKVKSQSNFPSKNYDEVLKGDLIQKLKNDFVPVTDEKQEYLYTVPQKTSIKPHTSHRHEVIFRPFKVKDPGDEEALRESMQRSKGSRKSQKSRKSMRRKSSRKSVSRKSVARKSKVARKSVARKSVARKSVARKSVARKSMKGGRKSTTGSRKSRMSRGGTGGKKSSSKKIEYIVEEEMFKKTFVSKVRLMLGSATKVLDWWFLGQVFEKMDDPRASHHTRKKK